MAGLDDVKLWVHAARRWLLDDEVEHAEMDEQQAREHAKPLGNVTVLDKDKADERETDGV